MVRLNNQLDTLEAELLSQVSAEALMGYTAQISREVRLSGSPEELRAFAYVKAQLEEWGWATRLIRHDAYVSWPGAAALTASGLGSVACITHAMATATSGTSAELVYVGQGSPAEYAGKNVVGKAVLVEGLAAPAKVKEAIAQGTIAQVFINDENFHEMINSWIWGSPTLEQLADMPTTPVVSVKRPDGVRLKAALDQGPVTITVQTEVETRWRTLPILEAELPGTEEPDKFVLFSGHIDSWHLGAMDNGSANATMMEVARILSGQRQNLKRGLRICFWSGHSHGRYAGSAWYADQRWDELRRNCVAHVNIDSVGAKGATVLTEAFCMAETRELGYAVIHGQTGTAYTGGRPSRSGDQSFLSHGIPSLLMSLSEQEPTQSDISPAAITGSKSGGLGYWWHTIHDTLDKLDPKFLVRDCRIYLAVILRLCAESVLPFNSQAAAAEYAAFVQQYQEKAGARFDLSPAALRAAVLLTEAHRFEEKVDALRQRITSGEQVDTESVRQVNARIMALGRALIPSNYTTQGPFGQDPALPIAPIPLLATIDRLVQTPEGSDETKHLTVGLVRARNRVCHALDEAISALAL
jgi:Iap family predicted aminopeptidase